MSRYLPEQHRKDGLVEIVSASVGAGHHAAAHAIAAQFEEQGYAARVWDVLDLMPGGLGRLIRATYVNQVQLAPATYVWTLRRSESRRSIELMRQALRPVYRPLLQIAADRPLALIAIHPFASQALGELRARELLRVPVITYLTDMSVHRTCVHRSVDLHLALHELPAEDAREAGAVAVGVVRPAVRGCVAVDPSSPRARAASRRALGLPMYERLVLVTGGSEGLGDLERTANDIVSTGAGTPVVLCGRNRRLLRRLTAGRSVLALGWSDDMPLLLAAADCVVQNAGGMMSLEALAAGVPVLSYRCIPGHGQTNASRLDQAGLVSWIRSYAQLGDSICSAVAHRAPVHSWPPLGPAGPPSVAQAALAPLQGLPA